MLAKSEKAINFIAKYMSIWIVIGALLSYLNPTHIAPLTKYVSYCIMAVMLAMGLTVRAKDFKLVVLRPFDVLCGVIFRYAIMPFVAFTLTKLLHLPVEIAVGLILVGCMPSGVASNVMTYLAKGDVALSVTVSTLNTILAPLLTPFIFIWLAGTMIHVDASAIILQIVEIVVVPVAIGACLRALASDAVDKVTPFVPLVSVLAIMIVTCSGIAATASKLATVALIAFVAVILHNSIGLTLGYWASRGVGMPHYKAKAITFEVGMENGGLAMSIAIAYLNPLTVLPAAIFNVIHNLTGPALAAYWRTKAEKEELAASERLDIATIPAVPPVHR